MANKRTKRLLSVTFVDENLVEKVQKQVSGEEVKLRPLSERVQGIKAKVPAKDASDDLKPLEELADDPNDVFFKPTELLEEGNDLRGSSVFGFFTPKKKGSMQEKANSAKKLCSPSTPKTPKSLLRHCPGTPKTPKTPVTASKHFHHERADSSKKMCFSPTLKTPKSILRSIGTPKTPNTPQSVSRGVQRTPKSKRKLSVDQPEPQTPYSFRKRVKQRIKRIVWEEDSSSSSDGEDSEFEAVSSEESSDDSKENDEIDDFIGTPKRYTKSGRSSFTPGKTSKAGGKTPSKSTGRTPSKTPLKGGKGRQVKDVEMVAKSEDYFRSHGDTGKIVTSDHTLNRLETPRLSPEALQSLLMGVTSSHLQERQALLEEHSHMFPRWMSFMCEGFSIFLYGLGSKKNLITHFQQQYLSEFDHIVVNGFFPSLTLRNILNNITEDILEHNGTFHGVPEQLDYIQGIYSNPNVEPLFVIIHNLDGPMLRGDKAQNTIARLASFPKIHLLASVDHINSPLLFDGRKMSKYNALWCDGTTLAPYSEETSYENSLMVQQSGALALSSLIHVFKSLTPNAKGIFLLLARHQLDQKDNSNYAGLSFNDLYQRCREAFLVNSDLTLRAQLTEFKDHKLIRSKKGIDGVENLIIPLDPSTLLDFTNQQEQDGL